MGQRAKRTLPACVTTPRTKQPPIICTTQPMKPGRRYRTSRWKTLGHSPAGLLRLGGSSVRQTSKPRAQADPLWSDWALAGTDGWNGTRAILKLDAQECLEHDRFGSHAAEAPARLIQPTWRRESAHGRTQRPSRKTPASSSRTISANAAASPAANSFHGTAALPCGRCEPPRVMQAKAGIGAELRP